jgi:hypothetical protein
VLEIDVVVVMRMALKLTMRFTCGERYRGRFIYAGTTLARLINPATNLEVGRVAGVVVWYFDTKGRYRSVSLPVMRDTR